MPDGLCFTSAASTVPAAAMFAAAGPLKDASALVLAEPGLPSLEVLCGLIQHGCAAAAEMPPTGLVPIKAAEIVLVPNLTRESDMRAALRLTRRCLLPCGRIVLQDSAGKLGDQIVAALHEAGFSNILIHAQADGAIISANKPMFNTFAGEVGHA